MPTVSSVSSSAGSAPSTDIASPSRIPQKQLGQDDFLTLLATQFQQQDPMKPMDDSAFIAQMAQFSSLQQSSDMAKDMSAMRADQQRATAASYLGHRVTVDAGNGQTVTDDVSAIDTSGTDPQLVVAGKSYSLSSVLRVEPSLISAPAPQPVNTGGA
jgi:flagellar basal-body rod modification protein FlgD